MHLDDPRTDVIISFGIATLSLAQALKQYITPLHNQSMDLRLHRACIVMGGGRRMGGEGQEAHACIQWSSVLEANFDIQRTECSFMAWLLLYLSSVGKQLPWLLT